jgi:hypothetical protein
MKDKGKKDKGTREEQKKGKQTVREKQKHKNEIATSVFGNPKLT